MHCFPGLGEQDYLLHKLIIHTAPTVSYWLLVATDSTCGGSGSVSLLVFWWVGRNTYWIIYHRKMLLLSNLQEVGLAILCPRLSISQACLLQEEESSRFDQSIFYDVTRNLDHCLLKG